MPNVHVVALHGEIDVSRKDATERALQHLDGFRAAFAFIDLSDVSYIDTTFLNLLLELQKQVSDRGDETTVAIIATPGSNARRLFCITALDARFAIYDDISAAHKAAYLR